MEHGVIQNHIKELEEKVLEAGPRRFGVDAGELVTDSMFLHAFRWCLNKTEDQLIKHKEEMRTRIIQYNISTMDHILLFTKEKIVYAVVQAVLQGKEK